jgi:hypothetical protein
MEAWIIGLHLVTVHAGALPDPGAHRALATPGIYAVAHSGLTFGAYRNSLSRTPNYPGDRYTAYAGWTWRTGVHVGPLQDVTITTAAASGYVAKVSPLLGLGATIGSGEYAPRILWVPHRTQPVSLAIERRF